MEEKIRALIARCAMLPEGAAVLAAVSGGKDSMCLLHYLHAQGYRVAAAHFNHHLRGEDADADEAFVRAWCAARGIPCHVGGAEVAALARARGESVEEAGRIARYAFLEETAARIGCPYIATAHHAQDNAETLLFNLVRGTGTDGLAGIPPVRGHLIRPMLTVSRAEIDAYAEKNGVPYREDRTNADTAYTRNYFRAEVLPKLQAVNPSAIGHISDTALRLREENEFLSALASERMNGLRVQHNAVSLPLSALREAPRVLRLRMLRLLLERIPVGKKDYTAAHFEALAALAQRSGSAQLDLPRGVCAENDGERLFLRCGAEKEDVRTRLSLNEPLRWGEYTICVRKAEKNRPLADDILYLPYDTIYNMLTVGAWSPRERMTPEGKTPRTLKRLFAEHGITPLQRERTPVLRVGDVLAAVYGIGVDAAFVPAEEQNAIAVEIRKFADN